MTAHVLVKETQPLAPEVVQQPSLEDLRLMLEILVETPHIFNNSLEALTKNFPLTVLEIACLITHGQLSTEDVSDEWLVAPTLAENFRVLAYVNGPSPEFANAANWDDAKLKAIAEKVPTAWLDDLSAALSFGPVTREGAIAAIVNQREIASNERQLFVNLLSLPDQQLKTILSFMEARPRKN